MNLVQNEWIKLWAKKQTWVFFILIIVGSIAVVPGYQFVVAQIDLGMELSAFTVLNDVVLVIASVITLFSVVVASSIVSSEMDQGTMKHLLIRPFSRWKILASKFVTTVAFAIVLLVSMVATIFVTSALLYGVGDASAPANDLFGMGMGGGLADGSTIGESILMQLGLYSLNLLVFIIFSFSISILFKSQTLAVGIGIFLLFGASMSQAFSMLLGDYAWYRYIVFPHMSLHSYVSMDEIVPGATLAFSIAILGVYSAVIFAAAFTLFQKRDLV
ncbi:ABC transporter permease subunit [Paenalkalicoccus suaedae]|uniref:ABC transporter permease subunit n=1 Tax=Paenalkalicoccus suaedae TaxID=2592382 RepID=A0A859FDZ8_9BACI|nr:ABC transporter permease subunit [Paenalkalicoccus suaedae]QKS70455.1 ABC transporter permease subunit [Paenalkalicoccus suaedae]